MKLYEPPAKEFFRLPNSIFHVPLDAAQFKLYAYLVCCSGSKGYLFFPSLQRRLRSDSTADALRHS